MAWGKVPKFRSSIADRRRGKLYPILCLLFLTTKVLSQKVSYLSILSLHNRLTHHRQTARRRPRRRCQSRPYRLWAVSIARRCLAGRAWCLAARLSPWPAAAWPPGRPPRRTRVSAAGWCARTAAHASARLATPLARILAPPECPWRLAALAARPPLVASRELAITPRTHCGNDMSGWELRHRKIQLSRASELIGWSRLNFNEACKIN